jgi:hypothetical protein
MKTLEEIIQQKPIFLHDWKQNGKEKIKQDFGYVYTDGFDSVKEAILKQEIIELIKKIDNINILFASYYYRNYHGEAWILFEENKELFEINASHCSCFGLEGQFDPEKVILKELKNRLEKGTFGKDDEFEINIFAKELKEFLGV